MKVFFSADCHFGHANIIKYAKRPFKNINYMNEELVKQWNKVVSSDDLVYHVGDFAFKGQGRKYEYRLNGDIVHIKGNHDCFSLDTELLTIDGWKKHSEVNIGDVIPTVNKETNSVEYYPILDKTLSHFNRAYTWNTRTSSGIVSHNHDMITLLNKDAYKGKERTWKKQKPCDIWNNKSRIIIPSSFQSGNVEYLNISDDLIRVLGWIYTDGSISKRGYIKIWQSKPENITHIIKLLLRMDVEFSVKKRIRERKKQFNKYGYEIKENYIPHIISISAKESKKLIKKLEIKTNRDIPLWLHHISDKRMGILIKEMVKGDGHIQTSNTRVLWGKYDFLSKIQGLLITHGIDCNLVQQKTRPDNYYLSIHVKRKHEQFIAPYGVKYIYPNNRKISYNPIYMWDVTVKNHNIFVRHDGKPYITGNSNNGIKTYISKCMMEFGGKEIYVNHHPPNNIDEVPICDFVICGHIHDKWKYKFVKNCDTPIINVGVDVWSYEPVSTLSLLKYYSKIKYKHSVDKKYGEFK